jgi:hypothetical protein
MVVNKFFNLSFLVTGAESGEEEKGVLCRSPFAFHLLMSISLAYEVFYFCLFSL